MSGCCGEAIINGIYRPLSERLLEYGREAYAGSEFNGNTVMWIFTFYDDMAACEACRNGLSGMYDWFYNYNLFDNPSKCVKIVVEPEPAANLIVTEMGWDKLPLNVFTDRDGRIFDMLFEFPSHEWLDKYILPRIQNS